jgi:hypothetical protein
MHGFRKYDETTDKQPFFPITIAERKAAGDPDGVADDLPCESVVFVEMG